MKIYLKQLDISDWKGIKKESFTFTANESYFLGNNGTGKTSVFASFIWLLIGIDNFDRADHQIKPLKNGEPEHRLDSQVQATLLIDDSYEIKLRRVLREEWVKPKTKEDEVFKGNTTLYFIDDVGVQKKEYDAKVGEFCPPFVFKAVTNPHYFTSLTRDDQRKMLFSMVDNVTDEQIAAGNPQFEALLKEVSRVSLSQLKKSLNTQKGIIQKDIADIVPRISELKRNKPEPKDWPQLKKELEEKEKDLTEVEGQITDGAKRSEAVNASRLQRQIEVNELVRANQQIEFSEQAKRIAEVEALKSKFRSVTIEVGNLQRDGVAKNTRKTYLTFEIDRLTKERAELLGEYIAVNKETLTFPEGSFECPTCHRPLDIEDIEAKQNEMTESFNLSKAGRIEVN
ncbi:MAG: AAA family ATPase, partial [Bacteroidales bacterium]|nr:AAA family ATPase [Bacteroidales bacterium]